MVENSEIKHWQILVLAPDGQSFIETIVSDHYRGLAETGTDGNNLVTYYDSKGTLRRNVEIISLGPVREKK